MTVKLHTMAALTRLNAPKLGRHVAKLIRDESGGVRVNAIDVVAGLGYTGAASVLIKALKDDKWYVRQAAARALGQLKIKKSGRELKESLNDERKAVREAASLAL